MNIVRWGIIGCGDVTEIKSGPALQKAEGSALAAVMRRDRAKADDYARRHGVPHAHSIAEALIDDPTVDAVYIATPPSSHCELALKVAAAGKPCLVEKPMAVSHAQRLAMIAAFEQRNVPLWVAYYRRAMGRFLKVRELASEGAIGPVTAVQLDVRDTLTATKPSDWRIDPDVAGAGLFFDLASHCFDLVDFIVGPVTALAGFSLNTGDRYAAEDATAAAFVLDGRVVGTGLWDFNADRRSNRLVLTGSAGTIETPVFDDDDVIVRRGHETEVFPIRNPPHVHQPLIQTIVDELRGRGRCESTGASGARASWALDECVRGYYATRSR